MTSEEYGQYIDDFELDVDVMPGESLTEYIERRRREFESKADGGSIGIEVLFKPKRQNFFMGGPALEGQALSIYTSMKDYGATDQAIADRLSSLGLYDPNASTPGAGDNIIGSQINQVGGGGGITELQKTFTPGAQPKGPKFDPNINPAFTLTGKGRLDPMGSDIDYFNSLRAQNDPRAFTSGLSIDKVGSDSRYFEEPSMLNKGITAVKDFFSGLSTPKVQGTLGTRLTNQKTLPIPLPSMITAQMRNPLNPGAVNFNPNLEAQLNFLETRGPGFIGRDPNSGGLKYGSESVLAGKNVISGFGTNDYEQMLMDYITKMSANTRISDAGRTARLNKAKAELAALTGQDPGNINIDEINTQMKIAKTNNISTQEAAGIMAAIDRDNRATESRGEREMGSSYDEGTYCFDPNTLVQMADGSEKKIKEIQLGDQTKGGEVTGVFQFKASDEIHDYKGVTVAGSHYVKEDGKFIMVKDSPLSVKIDKIPVVYSLDTTGRRIFINDIEFADYNGDGVAKNFLTNAGVDLTGFDTEVLRQVEHRLI